MSTYSDDPRFARLPKWAQAAMEYLERDVREANKRADENLKAAENPDSTDTVVEDLLHNTSQGLPKGQRITFFPEAPTAAQRRSHRVDARVVGRSVEIMGGGPLVVEMSSSNVFTVRVRDDR